MILATPVMLVVLGWATGFPVADDPESDPILRSFERELNHEPSPAAKARRESIDTDELYSMVNSVHWTQHDPDAKDVQETAARGTDDEEPAGN